MFQRERPRKLLLYLDQNFVSEMAKLDINPNINPDYRRLFEVLHAGFRDEKLVALRSHFHEVETSLAGHFRDPIRSRQATLGHVRLEPPYTVKQQQIGRALWRYKEGRGEIICHDDVLRDDPDKRVGHLDIDVDMDWRFSGAAKQRDEHARQLDALRQRLAANPVTYKRQFETELNSERQIMLSRANSVLFTATNEVSEEVWREFVLSDEFASVPVIKLEVALMARLLTGYPNRPVRPGDMTDLDAMATYLPYCDIYATDTFAAGLARSLSLEKIHSCQLFDAKKKGVRALTDYVSKALTKVPPVNTPILSIFVAADASIKQQSFAFYRELGLQAKRAEGCGNWVEIFGFNDGAMPRYQFKGIPDTSAPFYGLQEVTVIMCEAGASTDTLLAACRRECRSPRFVFVDTLKPLPPDFVEVALLTSMTGATEVCGYSVMT